METIVRICQGIVAVVVFLAFWALVGLVLDWWLMPPYERFLP